MPFQSLSALLGELITIPSMHRPYIHPQVVVRRSAARLARSTAARVQSIRSHCLPQRKYLGQWIEESHEHSPQRRWPGLVLLVQFLHVVGTYVTTCTCQSLFTGYQGSTWGNRGQEPWLQARTKCFSTARSVLYAL